MNRSSKPAAVIDRPAALRSMTGFGKGSAAAEGASLEVEIRSINHRFLDFSCKLPRCYAQFEHALREMVASRLDRGRVELFVTRRITRSGGAGVSFDKTLFQSLYALYLQIAASEAGLPAEDATLRERIFLEVMRRGDVIQSEDPLIDEQAEKRLLESAVMQALDGVCRMREEEGTVLLSDLRSRLAAVGAIRLKIEALGLAAPALLRERLAARLEKLAPEIRVDPGRLAQETALMADRVDITEELVRLKSHIDSFSRNLNSSSGGKKLDFLLQEMSREFNTIGSKGQDAELQALVIEAKQELEKIREQTQNIE